MTYIKSHEKKMNMGHMRISTSKIVKQTQA